MVILTLKSRIPCYGTQVLRQCTALSFSLGYTLSCHQKTFPFLYFCPEFHEFMVGKFHCIDFFSGKLLSFIFQNNPYFRKIDDKSNTGCFIRLP